MLVIQEPECLRARDRDGDHVFRFERRSGGASARSEGRFAPPRDAGRQVMRATHIVARTATRCAALAPVIGLTATFYALFAAFQRVGASQATWHNAVEGILRANAAVFVLLPISTLLIAAYELMRGRDGNNSAA